MSIIALCHPSPNVPNREAHTHSLTVSSGWAGRPFGEQWCAGKCGKRTVLIEVNGNLKNIVVVPFLKSSKWLFFEDILVCS
jgi:hypothetical protein